MPTKSWLDTIMKQTSELEAPPEFFYWAGLSALSAVVKKNLYIDKFAYKLYPNIYAMIIAKSGDRKSLPISLAKNLVSGVGNTRIMSGSNSIQAIINKLSKVTPLESGKSLTTGSAFLISEEFTNLILDDERAFNVLTELYDTHAYDRLPWINSLKQTGEEIVKEPYLTMLGASNEPLWNAKIPESSIGGGFIGRTLLIKSKKRGKPNSLARRPENVINYDELVPYLREVASLEGEFKYDNDSTIEFYDKWYNDHYLKQFDDDTGAANRLPDNILKVAMLMSLSESLSLVITKDHLEKSMDACYGFAVNVKNTLEGRGKARLAEPMRIFATELAASADDGKRVYKATLLRKHRGHFDAADLEQMVQTFITCEMITVHSSDGKTFYEPTQKVLNARKSLERE